MKIFVLDDMEERQQWFAMNLPTFFDNLTLFAARDVDEAIACFENEKEFDWMFLDHDLGNRTFVPSDDANTGYQVAKYIANHNIRCENIIIHSHNYAGAQRMQPFLHNARYLPFTMLVKRFK